MWTLRRRRPVGGAVEEQRWNLWVPLHDQARLMHGQFKPAALPYAARHALTTPPAGPKQGLVEARRAPGRRWGVVCGRLTCPKLAPAVQLVTNAALSLHRL